MNESREQEIQALAREGLGRYPNDQRLNSIVGVYYFRRFGRDLRVPGIRRDEGSELGMALVTGDGDFLVAEFQQILFST